MTFEGWAVLATIVACLTVLIGTSISVDIVLFAGLAVLFISGILPAEQALSGFSNEGMLTVGALYIVAAGLKETGAIQFIVHRVMGNAKTVKNAQLRIMSPVMVMSAFLNNTPIVASFIPALERWSRISNIPVSKILIPLSYAAILGGTCTLIGTSTNLIINGLMIEEASVRSLGILEPALIGIPFAVADERRYLFPLFPFLIILSTIAIQRVTNYGLNTFSFSHRQKSIFLVITTGIVLLLSVIFTTGITGFGYGPPNTAFENEKIEFTEYLVDNYDGRILRDEIVIDYLAYVSLTSDDNDFKSFKSPRGKNPYPDLYEPGKVVWLSVNGKTIEELITNGETRELKYIGILEKGSYFFPFLNDLYYNEEKYPYMEKIFDSDEMDYKEFKIKAFEINYQKFHELYG